MAKKNNPTGFEYKMLPSDKVTLKPIPNPDIDIKIAEEKNDLAKEQGKLTYGQRRSEELREAHDSPGNLYGSPAPTYLKVTPLHKRGKLDINYAAQLTEAGKTAILNSDANDAFKEVIRETPTEEDKNKKS